MELGIINLRYNFEDKKMEEAFKIPACMRLKHSYDHERLARIETPFYARPSRQTKGQDPSPSAKILNYVKGKFQIALDTIKKMFSSEAEPYPNYTNSNLGNLELRDNINMSKITNSIKQVINYPEYRDLYKVGGNKQASSKKATFLNVLKYHKDVLTNKIREKMEREGLTTIPFYTTCKVKPIPLKLKKNPVVFEKKHSRYISTRQVGEMRNVEEEYKIEPEDYKAQLKRKQRENQPQNLLKLRRVNFPEGLELKKVKKFYRDLTCQQNSSSAIQYFSSGDSDEEIANHARPKKKLITQEKEIVQKRPPIQLKPKKKSKVNVFEKARLAKVNLQPASVAKAEKFVLDDYASFDLKAKNHDNSFASDHNVNDSKLETDSDESNIAYNANQNFNVLNELHKMSRKNSLSISSVSYKSELSPKQMKEFNENDSPIMEDEEVKHLEEFPSKKTTPKMSFSKSSSGESLNQTELPEVKQPETKPYLHISFTKEEDKPENPPLQEQQQQPQPQPQPSSIEAPFVETTKTHQEPEETNQFQEVKESKESKEYKEEDKPKTTENIVENESKPQLFVTPSQEKKQSEGGDDLTPDKKKFSITQEALNNPLFANIKLNKPVEPTNNPFLMTTPRSTLSLSDIIKPSAKNESNNAVEDNKPVVGPFTPTTEAPKPSGLLALIKNQQQQQQSSVSQTSQATENTPTTSKLTYSGSLSWLTSNEPPQTNIFSNINTITNNSSGNILNSGKSNNSVFSSIFSNFNNNNNMNSNQGAPSGGLAGLFQNNSNNMPMGNNNSMNNNNNGMMGGASFLFGNNNNNAMNSSSSFQNLINQTQININSNSGNSNPFSMGGGNNFFGGGNNPIGGNSLFGDSGSQQMANNPFGFTGNLGGGSYSQSSGRKKNMKERAF